MSPLWLVHHPGVTSPGHVTQITAALLPLGQTTRPSSELAGQWGCQPGPLGVAPAPFQPHSCLMA